ncbi:C-C chemokine receptor type 1-like [Saccopteryx leptura]|uniref:C-C chemokine receptor type 1-like n=1 Tax=Saccopteryx leptura TaxID=249018 RepID=UPI00339BA893
MAQGGKPLEISQVGTQEGTVDTDESKDKVEGVSRKDSDVNRSCPFPMLMLGLLAQDFRQQRNRQSLWVQVLPNSSSGSQQNEDWRSFGAQLLPPLYSLVFVTGLVGNILVILTLLQHKRLKNMTSIYLLNLAISDLLFLFTLPFWIHYYQKDNWVFGSVMCKLLWVLYYVGLYSEIFFIILLTIDRYLAIVHAVFALRARTVTFGIITSVVSWVLAILGFYFSESQDESYRYSYTVYFPPEYHNQWKWILALKLNILGLVLSLVIMIVCYTGIIKILLRRPNERESKVFCLIFVIMTMFFLFSMPFNLTISIYAFDDILLVNFCNQKDQLALAIPVTEVIAYMHCCLNPIIDVFVGERFHEYPISCSTGSCP